jgi:hypothetical protein
MSALRPRFFSPSAGDPMPKYAGGNSCQFLPIYYTSIYFRKKEEESKSLQATPHCLDDRHKNIETYLDNVFKLPTNERQCVLKWNLNSPMPTDTFARYSKRQD